MVPVADPAEEHQPERADELPAARLVQGAVGPALQLTRRDASTGERPELRIVLDTNVAVALVVFADPRLDALAAQWKAGALEAVVDDGTLAEFDRVLHYPELKLDPPRIAAARDAYRAATVPLAHIELPEARSVQRALPRCSDPDDQMFLVLADAARADCLLTRDKALLKLGRARYRLPFRIAQPEAIVLPP